GPRIASLPRQVQRIAGRAHGLIGVAEHRERTAYLASAIQPRVETIARSIGEMFLRVVKGNRPLELVTRFDQLSEKLQRITERSVRSHQYDWVLEIPCFLEQSFPRPSSGSIFRPYHIINTQPQVELAGFAEPLAQFIRPEQALLRFHGGIAFGDHQR